MKFDYHIYQALRSGRTWHKVKFLAEFNWFEFRVFLLVASPRLKNPVCPTIYSWRENNWSHTFRKGISEMQSVSSRNWTRVAVSISCDDNHYTMGTSTNWNIDYTTKWYMHKPKSVRENETYEFLLDFEIQTDNLISTRRADLVIKKENLLSSGLGHSSGSRNENQRKRKERQVFGPCQTTKKCCGTWGWRWYQM